MVSKTKRIVVGLLVISALFISITFSRMPVYAEDGVQITDLNQCAEIAKPAVSYLIQNGIISGNNGKFNPKDILTRAQMVKMLVISMGKGIDSIQMPVEASFKDVPKNHWAFPYVEAALVNGWVVMSPSKIFGVNDKCTREQMATMLVRSMDITINMLRVNQQLDSVYSLADGKGISSWAKNHVEFCIDNKLMLGVGGGRFLPSGNTERQQAAMVIYRFLNSKQELLQAKKIYERAIQFTELYNALADNTMLNRGRIAADISISAQGRQMNSNDEYVEALSIKMLMNAVKNMEDSHLDLSLDMTIEGQKSEKQIYEIITFNGKTYYKENQVNEWELLSKAQLDQGILPIGDVKDFAVSGEESLQNYNNLLITKDTQVFGEKTYTSYNMNYNNINYKGSGLDIVENMIGDESKTLEELYNGGFDFDYTILLNENNVIEKVKANFTGRMLIEEQDTDANFKLSMDMTYSDLGVDIPIIAPVIK